MDNIYQPLIDWHLKEANRLQNKGNNNSSGEKRNSLKLTPVPEGDCCLVRAKGRIFMAARKGRNYSTADMIAISNAAKWEFRKDAPSGALIEDANDDELARKYRKWDTFMNEEFMRLKERYNEN